MSSERKQLSHCLTFNAISDCPHMFYTSNNDALDVNRTFREHCTLDGAPL